MCTFYFACLVDFFNRYCNCMDKFMISYSLTTFWRIKFNGQEAYKDEEETLNEMCKSKESDQVNLEKWVNKENKRRLCENSCSMQDMCTIMARLRNYFQAKQLRSRSSLLGQFFGRARGSIFKPIPTVRLVPNHGQASIFVEIWFWAQFQYIYQFDL